MKRTGLTPQEIADIGKRIGQGIPSSSRGLSMAPWVQQALADRDKLFAEVIRRGGGK